MKDGEHKRIYRASKDAERRICRIWGGERWGNRGSGHSDGDEAIPVSLEVKRSKKAPRVSYEWLKQCWTNAKTEGKPPVLVVLAPGQRWQEAIVVCNHGWLVEQLRKAGIIPSGRDSTTRKAEATKEE